jgi:hypothetical protein
MAYRLWPAMKKLPLALAQFLITVIGSAGVIVASYLLVSVPLAAIASVAMIIGSALMSWLFIARGREAM